MIRALLLVALSSAVILCSVASLPNSEREARKIPTPPSCGDCQPAVTFAE